MNRPITKIQEITLENWHFALAPLSDDEQKRITIAIAGIQKLASHLQVDENIGEMDFVAGCFADLVCQNLTQKEQVRKLFNHTLARALKEREEAA